ncbi:hypothetical protein M422DRAFT_261540 [Sphaerobolus stellatus SS14]|uniref:Uncharacterized protein n=1 Tax=Sphaerobolus stellatus (strain SS14) TaxID=990650 RepID=A0A0C9UMX7_SPHS4|nr:hypothetical protein M422DRAFT_261540 [Sphaerobolus stellatus SS14]
MILGTIDTTGSFSYPWIYIKSLYILGKESWLSAIIGRGYFPNLKRLIITWQGNSIDEASVPSVDFQREAPIKPKLSEVVTFHAGSGNILFHEMREHSIADFKSVPHSFFGKLYGPKDSLGYTTYFLHPSGNTK